MDNISSIPNSLQTFLRQTNLEIWYTPLANEPDPRRIPLPASLHNNRIVVTNARDTDPVQNASEIIRGQEGATAYILIPGRQFDRWGTRHGRGGGWYDRFLDKLPAAWMRIGVCFLDQISATHLQRESWDQPVDWLFIEREDGWTFVSTGAREEYAAQ